MDILSPMILLHENGYKTLTTPDDRDTFRIAMVELRDKIVRLGEGHLDVAVGFANREDEIGEVGRSFNHTVQQLFENRREVERLHRDQMSRAECLARAASE